MAAAGLRGAVGVRGAGGLGACGAAAALVLCPRDAAMGVLTWGAECWADPWRAGCPAVLKAVMLNVLRALSWSRVISPVERDPRTAFGLGAMESVLERPPEPPSPMPLWAGCLQWIRPGPRAAWPGKPPGMGHPWLKRVRTLVHACLKACVSVTQKSIQNGKMEIATCRLWWHWSLRAPSKWLFSAVSPGQLSVVLGIGLLCKQLETAELFVNAAL